MIRPYKSADLDQLLDIWYRASKLAHPFLDENFLSGERASIATKHLPSAETWVYILGGKVVGFVALVGNEVGGLFVDPDFHRKGIGGALVDHALAQCGQLEVEVFLENVIGRKFYDRYGFQPVKELVHEQTGRSVLRMHYPAEMHRQ
ncbi:MAG TPA: GNAT family N-acetyltransferase [Rhodothermales bacterium]